jgi:hypothetical protein
VNSQVFAVDATSGERRVLAERLSGDLNEVVVSPDLQQVMYVDAYQRARIVRVGVTSAEAFADRDLVPAACRQLRPHPEYAVVRDVCGP